MHRGENMNKHPRSAERVIRACLAGTPPVRSADLERVYGQCRRMPGIEHHQTHPAKLSG